jgi:hypothetical protein
LGLPQLSLYGIGAKYSPMAFYWMTASSNLQSSWEQCFLPAPEGYRFGHRETLSWGGPPEACRETVQGYLSKAGNESVMPLHVADWWSVSDLVKPTDTGRLQFVLIQELRHSKRLLPFDKTADVEADPFRSKLRSPGAAEDRFALVQARLGNIMFVDGFE